MEDEIEDTTDSAADEVTADEVGDEAGSEAIDPSVYEAKIAELSAAIETHLNTIATLKAQNYDLITAQTRDNADDTGVVQDSADEPDDVTIDDLFEDKED